MNLTSFKLGVTYPGAPGTPKHCCPSRCKMRREAPHPTTMYNEGCKLVALRPSSGGYGDLRGHMESNPHNSQMKNGGGGSQTHSELTAEVVGSPTCSRTSQNSVAEERILAMG